MAHTRVFRLLRYLHYRRPMDDLRAGAAQFQCVSLCRVLARMSSLTRAGVFLTFSETHPNYDLYRHRLARGWLPGTQIVSFASCTFLSHHAPSLYALFPDSIGMLPTQDPSLVNLDLPLMIVYIRIHGLANTAL